MNWNSIQENWSELRGRVMGHWNARSDDEHSRRHCEEYLRQHCGAPREEACRHRRDWINDPGVLDDWNDTRSILDM